MKTQLLCLPALFLLFSSCTAHYGRLNLISNESAEKIDSVTTRLSNEMVRGKSCKHFVLFVPVTGGNNIDEAIEEAISSTTEADALTDVRIEMSRVVTFLYNSYCIRATGYPVSVK